MGWDRATEEADLGFIDSRAVRRILQHERQSHDSISPRLSPESFVSPPDEEGTRIAGKFTWRVLI